MQKNTTFWKRNGRALTMALLFASLPLVTACNPFTGESVVAPACETNNTAEVTFKNSTATTQYWYVDYSLATSVAAYSSSSARTYKAGTSYYVQVKNVSGVAVCAASYKSWSQCTTNTLTC